MTPTAMACADVFVPLAAYPEHQAVVLNHYAGSPNVIGSVNKVDAGETHPLISNSCMTWVVDACQRHSACTTISTNLLRTSRLGNTVKVEAFKKGSDVRETLAISTRTGHLRPDIPPGSTLPQVA